MTLNNYWAVLRGDASAIVGGSGNVLKSGGDSFVFMSYDDHGGKGKVGFPGGGIHADDLQIALLGMRKNKQFGYLMFYLEACFSGTMFEGLPTDESIYAVTSANGNEYGWETYCPPDEIVQGTHIGACIADELNANYLENMDANPLNTQTIQSQYLVIKNGTEKSHPLQHGDLSITSMPVSNFFGSSSGDRTTNQQHIVDGDKKRNSVSKLDGKLFYLVNKHAREMSEQSEQELNQEIMSRKYYDDVFSKITEPFKIKDQKTTDFTCYRMLENLFIKECDTITDYAMMKYSSVFYDVCGDATIDSSSVATRMIEVCSKIN